MAHVAFAGNFWYALVLEKHRENGCADDDTEAAFGIKITINKTRQKQTDVFRGEMGIILSFH